LRLGIHTSTAGGLERAAQKAAELGANTFQIFSASPRMWRALPPDPEQVRLLRTARERFDLNPLAIHVNYLVNLASLDPVIRRKSIAGFRGELERALAIGAEYLVLHPGSHRGITVEEGIAAFVEGMAEAARRLDTRSVTVLLENTAGAGSHLGSRFAELRAIGDLAAARSGVATGYCLDTCHLLAAGFDLATADGLRATLREAEAALGLANVRVIHANDSKGALASRLDRHANIGEGHIGRAGFHRILTHPRLRGKPFILETPVEEEGDDRRNLDALQRLARTAPRQVIR
jgi:deoxyribonuclease-4